MGICGSSGTGAINVDIMVVRRCHELGLTMPDVEALWQFFKKADLSGDKNLNVNELCVQHEVQNESFGRLLFSHFDHDGSGSLTFEEFCLCIWNVSTLDEAALPRFIFRLFDVDNSGSLSQDEVVKMIKVILTQTLSLLHTYHHLTHSPLPLSNLISKQEHLRK